MTIPLRIAGRDFKPHKATIEPLLGARTVLTEAPWEFVSLWLRREKKSAAHFYWSQARSFADAGRELPLHSAPLLHYYSFMNAAKALLSAKNVLIDEYHGVTSYSAATRKLTLANIGVTIKTNGVLPSLAAYLGDTETKRKHTLKELLYNLPFVHRSYCLTYRSQSDLFFPLTECRYVFDTASKTAHFEGNLSADFAATRYIKKLPATFILDTSRADIRAIRSAQTVNVAAKDVKSVTDITAMKAFNRSIRQDLLYINATQTLWYAKAVVAGPVRLRRSPLTLTLAAMHRLSELCRYKPQLLASLLDGQTNWLLSEFVLSAPSQFLDGIASELTGYQFMVPNVRPAT